MKLNGLLVCCLTIYAAGVLELAQARQLQRLRTDTCDTTTYSTLKPTILESRAVSVDWVGADDQHVFITTIKSQVWQSKDGGSTFQDITSKFTGLDTSGDMGGIMNIFASKANPSSILFQGSGGNFWLTNDYADTVTSHPTPGGWRGAQSEIKPHPTRDGWFLVLARRPDCTAYDPVQMQCPQDLHMTQDAFGALTWLNLTANAGGKIAGFVDYDWGQLLCAKQPGGCSATAATAAAAIPEQSILATLYRHAGDWDMAWDPDLSFVRSDDLFKTVAREVKCGNQFEIVGGGLYLAVANSCPTDVEGKPRPPDTQFPRGITLYSTVDGAQTFVQACLPVALRSEGFELMETHDGAGAVAIVDYKVRTSFADLQASSVYTVGPHKALFSLSLTDVYRHDSMSAAADFARVEAVPGVYIANQMYIDDELSRLLDAPLVSSKITYNGGAHWQFLRAPAPGKYNFPNCDQCDGKPDCYLHLHGASSWFYGLIPFPAVYSHPAAPGLLMGSGNVAEKGLGLNDNGGLCTWLSNDGGATWTDVADGAFIYEYADWGGVIFMARHELSGPADEIRFSLDYGRCWSSVPLDTALMVDNIKIEPDGQRPRVLLYGKACHQDKNPKCSMDANNRTWALAGYVYSVDITAIMGDKLPACGAVDGADFEKWSVPSPLGAPQCLLGQQMQFTRRKQGVRCVQGGAFQRPAAVNSTCDCSQQDVECDYGYVRDDAGGCVALPRDKLPTCPAVDTGKYSVSKTGLRLVHGDVCSGIDKVIDDTDGGGGAAKGGGGGDSAGGDDSKGAGGGPSPSPGPGAGGGGGSKGGGTDRKKHGALFGFVIFMLVAGGVAGAFTLWWQFAASDAARDAVRSTVGPAAAAVAGVAEWVFGWVLDKCWPGRRRAEGPADAELHYFQPLEDMDEEPNAVYSLR